MLSPRDIYDADDQRCTAVLIVEGEHHQCDLRRHHDGWAHSNRDAKALWKGRDDE